MPNRILRDGILESELVDALDWPAECFYRRLMSVVDDFGRYSADPVILRAKCYPRRVEEVTPTQVEGWLNECAAAGLVGLYQVDGKKYLIFHKLGNPRAKESKYPAPNLQAHASTCMQTQTYVPYSYSDSYSDSSSYSGSDSNADSNARRRGAARRNGLSREGSKPAETVTAGPSRQGQEPQTVTISHEDQALSAIRGRFPVCDRELAAKVAATAIQAHSAITPEELAAVIPLAMRKHMREPGLLLTTVPEEIRRRLANGRLDLPARASPAVSPPVKTCPRCDSVGLVAVGERSGIPGTVAEQAAALRRKEFELCSCSFGREAGELFATIGQTQ